MKSLKGILAAAGLVARDKVTGAAKEEKLEAGDHDRLIPPAVIDAGGNITFKIDRRSKRNANWFARNTADGPYEPLLSALVTGFIAHKPDAIFYDIGALHGYFSLLAAAASGGKAQIYGFEMNPSSTVTFRRNVRVNGAAFANIHPMNAAVADVEELGRPTRYRGFHFDVTDDDPKVRTANIDFVTIDTFASRNAHRPDLYKIDVEGAEGMVLKGGAATLRDSDPVLLMELHSERHLRGFDTNRSAVIEMAQDYGFKAYATGGRKDAVKKDGFTALPIDSETVTQAIDRAGQIIILMRAEPQSIWPDIVMES